MIFYILILIIIFGSNKTSAAVIFKKRAKVCKNTNKRVKYKVYFDIFSTNARISNEQDKALCYFDANFIQFVTVF